VKIDRSLWGQLALLVLSIPGIGISIYLIAVKLQGAALICSDTGIVNCDLVTNSSFGVVPFTQIPISVPGLAWFLVMAGLAAATLFGITPRLMRRLELVWAGLGMLTVFYLLYAEIVRLGHFCLWCSILHVIIFAMILIIIFDLRSSNDDEDYEDEDEPATEVDSSKSGASIM
jgi:uncharacterized membrane protein